MFKQFLSVLKKYIRPYKKNVAWSVVMNFMAQWLNVFSFATIVPILNILFKIDTQRYEYIEFAWSDINKDILINNAYWKVQQIIESNGAFATLLYMGLALIVLTGMKAFCYFASSALIMPMRTGMIRDIRVELYNKIVRLPLSFFSEERKGDIMARITSDAATVESSLTSGLDMLLKNPIAIIVCLTTLLTVSWELTIFFLILAPTAGWVLGTISRKLKSQSKQVTQMWGGITSQIDETLGGLRVIKAFMAEKRMTQRFTDTSNKYCAARTRMNIRQASAHPMSEFLGTVLIMIVLFFGGYLIINGKSTIDASMFIFYMVILYSIINPLKEFSKTYYNVPLGMAAMDRINFILNAENHIKNPQHPLPMDEFQSSIVFSDVTFGYNAERDVVKHINLTVPKGKTIALVGQSGSGKSTLVDLVPRYHDVCSGEILIDGKNVKDLMISDLRALIGNVNQEAILFNDTFFNNITFGCPDATMEQVIEAAKIANAHEFIMESENGYDTMVGDRGCRLSGGQRQRVSIARAILKNPPILILDEATSALDTESERLVQEALERLMKSRTTIAIAHRLSTIKHADEIYVLHEGEIVERGTHEELLAKNGYYKRLTEMQGMA